MKSVVVCLLVVFAIAKISAQSHNISWGTPGITDRLLFRETIVKSSSWLQIVTKDVTYQGQSRITAIKCTDKYTNDNGGYATLYNGGVGYTEVTIHLKSQRGHGINFIVEVFGPNDFKLL